VRETEAGMLAGIVSQGGSISDQLDGEKLGSRTQRLIRNKHEISTK
jgi:hypothetical protein